MLPPVNLTRELAQDLIQRGQLSVEIFLNAAQRDDELSIKTYIHLIAVQALPGPGNHGHHDVVGDNVVIFYHDLHGLQRHILGPVMGSEHAILDGALLVFREVPRHGLSRLPTCLIWSCLIEVPKHEICVGFTACFGSKMVYYSSLHFGGIL